MVSLPITDALTGTFSTATTLNSAYKFTFPATILDSSLEVEVLGTGTASEVQLGHQLAGTGTWTVIGTASTIGTSAVGDFISLNVVETDILAGDTVSLYVYGTDNALATTLIPNVEYKERFLTSDS